MSNYILPDHICKACGSNILCWDITYSREKIGCSNRKCKYKHPVDKTSILPKWAIKRPDRCLDILELKTRRSDEN